MTTSRASQHMRSSKLRSLVAAVALALVAQFVAVSSLAAAEAAALRAAAATIVADDLKHHVEVLADDSFEGREAGSRGGRAAGGYLLTYFEKFGLRGAGEDGGYVQPFGSGYRNVLGLLEGSDEQLRHEVVIISAHYDHVGYGNGSNSFGPTGYIHNGADDNASGTSALLECMEAFATLSEPPRRSILFASWDAEEKGLLGSIYWIKHPTVPLDHVAFVINVDMLGRLRNDRLEVYGSRTSYSVRRMLSTLNDQYAGLDLDFNWDMRSDSDHYPFYSEGVPVVMLHTGLHDDYHRPSDDADKINAEGMQRATRLLFCAADDLADEPVLPRFRNTSRRESSDDRRQLERELAPVSPRLGVAWEEPEGGSSNGDSQAGGLVLTRVESGSAAERAGLSVGDQLLEFAGRPVSDPSQLVLDVLDAPSRVDVVVERPGETEPRTLTVHLSGSPMRVGISWRDDDAEPGASIVTRVVPGSRAARAGVRPGDRIYEVSGHQYKSGDELRDLLTTLDGPIEMVLERRGRLSRVSINVPPAASGQAVSEPPEAAP